MSPPRAIQPVREGAQSDNLAIPERPGNRWADSLLNVLSNPGVGLLFLIPGRNDTLRVNGRARIVREAP